MKPMNGVHGIVSCSVVYFIERELFVGISTLPM